MPRGFGGVDSVPNPPPEQKAPEKKEPIPRPAPAQPPKNAQTWGGQPRYPVTTVPFRPPPPRPAPASDMSLPIQIGILALLAVFLFMSLRSG